MAKQLARRPIVLRCEARLDGVALDFEAAGDDLLAALDDLARQIHDAGGCSTPDEFVVAWLAANPDAVRRMAAN